MSKSGGVALAVYQNIRGAVAHIFPVSTYFYLHGFGFKGEGDVIILSNAKEWVLIGGMAILAVGTATATTGASAGARSRVSGAGRVRFA
jgi:hypothetical protein